MMDPFSPSSSETPLARRPLSPQLFRDINVDEEPPPSLPSPTPATITAITAINTTTATHPKRTSVRFSTPPPLRHTQEIHDDNNQGDDEADRSPAEPQGLDKTTTVDELYHELEDALAVLQDKKENLEREGKERSSVQLLHMNEYWSAVEAATRAFQACHMVISASGKTEGLPSMTPAGAKRSHHSSLLSTPAARTPAGRSPPTPLTPRSDEDSELTTQALRACHRRLVAFTQGFQESWSMQRRVMFWTVQKNLLAEQQSSKDLNEPCDTSRLDIDKMLETVASLQGLADELSVEMTNDKQRVRRLSNEIDKSMQKQLNVSKAGAYNCEMAMQLESVVGRVSRLQHMMKYPLQASLLRKPSICLRRAHTSALEGLEESDDDDDKPSASSRPLTAHPHLQHRRTVSTDDVSPLSRAVRHTGFDSIDTAGGHLPLATAFGSLAALPSEAQGQDELDAVPMTARGQRRIEMMQKQKDLWGGEGSMGSSAESSGIGSEEAKSEADRQRPLSSPSLASQPLPLLPAIKTLKDHHQQQSMETKVTGTEVLQDDRVNQGAPEKDIDVVSPGLDMPGPPLIGALIQATTGQVEEQQQQRLNDTAEDNEVKETMNSKQQQRLNDTAEDNEVKETMNSKRANVQAYTSTSLSPRSTTSSSGIPVRPRSSADGMVGRARRDLKQLRSQSRGVYKNAHLMQDKPTSPPGPQQSQRAALPKPCAIRPDAAAFDPISSLLLSDEEEEFHRQRAGRRASRATQADSQQPKEQKVKERRCCWCFPCSWRWPWQAREESSQAAVE
ncbi:unnamed protein product [Vitrella brassicaformis CCMP3155]|uniref:Uncharacterized protein n=2 Tax=Vitrella brassicaformis TaxID=1169539 RepID=A0A0G4EBQ9_VITBC|nr:unnamed protein product [Vitrella brassicaformis CCMP3155]|eukprot:CEL92965.1 unnamed protein product [Vitrella brassicaformis CCMP3155]